MAANAPGDAERKPTIRLNIRTDADFQSFMRAILPEFLRVVDPRESGFLDVLYANDVITESDDSSLSGKDVLTRKDQARKLFVLLSSLPVQQFLEKVAPELCTTFPHIIPGKFRVVEREPTTSAQYTTDASVGQCLHHSIQQRVRAGTMADTLYQQAVLTLEEYRAITEGARMRKDVWVPMFQKLQQLSDEQIIQVEDCIMKLLRQYHIPLPENVKELISCGLPCTCSGNQLRPPTASVLFVGKVQAWLNNGNLSALPMTSTVPPKLCMIATGAGSLSDDLTQERSTQATSTVDSEITSDTHSQSGFDSYAEQKRYPLPIYDRIEKRTKKRNEYVGERRFEYQRKKEEAQHFFRQRSYVPEYYSPFFELGRNQFSPAPRFGANRHLINLPPFSIDPPFPDQFISSVGFDHKLTDVNIGSDTPNLRFYDNYHNIKVADKPNGFQRGDGLDDRRFANNSVDRQPRHGLDHRTFSLNSFNRRIGNGLVDRRFRQNAQMQQLFTRPQIESKFARPQNRPQFAQPKNRPQFAPPDTRRQFAPPDTRHQFAPPENRPHFVPTDTRPHSVPTDTLPQFVPPDTRSQFVPPGTRRQFAPPDTRPQFAPPDIRPQFVPPDTCPQFVPPDTRHQFVPPDNRPQIVPPDNRPQFVPIDHCPQFGPPEK